MEPPPEPAPAGTRPGPGAPRRRGRRVALAGGLLALTLAAAEGVARLVVDPPANDFAAHHYYRLVRTPDHVYEVVDPVTGELRPFRVDGHGFRSTRLEPPGTPRAPGSYRLFFVGSSTTESVVLPDERTFPYLVEQALDARLPGGPRPVVVNAGLSGFQVADTYSLVVHRILPLEPDAIVFMQTIKDLVESLSVRHDPTHYAARQELEPPSFSDWAHGASRLLQLADQLDRRLGQGRREARRMRKRAAHPVTPVDDPDRGVPYLLRYLRLLLGACRQAGVPLVLMTEPTLYHEGMSQAELDTLRLGWVNKGELNLDAATLERGMARYNEALRRFAAEEGLLLIDLAPVVPRDLEHFYDDCHTTARGNQVMAEAIVPALLRDGRLP